MSSNQLVINIGSTPNDGAGDPLRVAFGKINNNFSNLFSTTVNTSNSYTIGNAANQVIFQISANTFNQGQMFIQTSDPAGNSSQTIQISAQVSSNKANVVFTGYGSTFFGNALASYNMDINAGNIRILCNPLVNKTLFHFVGSEVLWIGETIPGLDLALDGYTNSILTTENDFDIVTET